MAPPSTPTSPFRLTLKNTFIEMVLDQETPSTSRRRANSEGALRQAMLVAETGLTTKQPNQNWRYDLPCGEAHDASVSTQTRTETNSYDSPRSIDGSVDYFSAPIGVLDQMPVDSYSLRCPIAVGGTPNDISSQWPEVGVTEWNSRSLGQCEASRKLFIGGLSYFTTDSQLRKHFSNYGRVLDAVVMRRNGVSRGFGFVTFSAATSAHAAIAEPRPLGGRQIDVKLSVPEESIINKIFVGNIPKCVSRAELVEYFGTFGNIVDAVILADASGKSRSLGFICFNKDAEGDAAAEAVLSSRHEVKGKCLEVHQRIRSGTRQRGLRRMFPRA
mmetsp:Transcript_46495/g.101146  ORF Transcript_46495/g.101146 Transcript_46495/m.101146 type:complete len:329 (-) Transcript_46495:77-1063(-)